jgi:hypothetical protein
LVARRLGAGHLRDLFLYAADVLLAELEVRHSRPIAPTRRVALGELFLPCDPAPGFGGLLLASVVGAFIGELDDEWRDGLDRLMEDLERGRRIAQPRLRHRFQQDTIGLDRSRHRLTGEGEALDLEIDDHSAALPQILGSVYAASKLSLKARPAAFRLLRRATRWQGEPNRQLLGYLTGENPRLPGVEGDEGWALAVLGFSIGHEPSRTSIQRRFRQLVRDAHPDHGGSADGAGQRILDLTEAKRVLLAAD